MMNLKRNFVFCTRETEYMFEVTGSYLEKSSNLGNRKNFQKLKRQNMDRQAKRGELVMYLKLKQSLYLIFS